MAKVTQEFQAVGEERIARAYEKMAKKASELQDKLDRLADSSRRSAKEGQQSGEAMSAAFGAGIRQAAALGAQFLGVRAILSGINDELREMRDLQREAAQTQAKIAGGQAELFLNTFGQDEATKKQYMDAAARISQRTGVPEADVLRSLGRQAGRGINLSAEQIIGAQEYATRLGRHTPEQIEPLSTVIQQTMRATGMPAEWAAALAQSGAAAAFPGDPRLQSRFLQQALTGSLANIDKPDAAAAEQIFELAGALSQAGGEERGEAGRTATISLLAQFEEFREGRGKWALNYGGQTFKAPVKGAPTRPGDFIEWLRANPRQMRRFFDRASFEQHYEGIIRRMVMDPTSQVGQLYEGSKEAVRPDIDSLRAQLAEIEGGTPEIRGTMQQQQLENIEQRREKAMTPEAAAERARQIRDNALKATRRLSEGPPGTRYGIETTASAIMDFFTKEEDVAGLAINRLENRASFIGRSAAVRAGREGHPGDVRLTGQEQRALDYLRDQINLLKSIDGEMKLMRQEGGNRSPSLSPAMNAQRGLHNERHGASGAW